MRYESGEHFKGENGYDIEGAWYPRVTRILSIKSKPGLDVFLKEVGDYAAAEEIKQKSAAEGSLVHKTIEQIALKSGDLIPSGMEPVADAFEKFQQERGVLFHPDFVELRFWSERHRYAGTADALATIDGKFGVLDIKTSLGFYPEYNLQTAAYVSAMQEFEIKRALKIPRDIETRWIMLVQQHEVCRMCGAKRRTKGGRVRINNGRSRGMPVCVDSEHDWGPPRAELTLREFPFLYKDTRAFLAAKILWEWEHDYWLKRIGYVPQNGNTGYNRGV